MKTNTLLIFVALLILLAFTLPMAKFYYHKSLVKVNQQWERVYLEGTPFSEVAYDTLTILEIKDNYARCHTSVGDFETTYKTHYIPRLFNLIKE